MINQERIHNREHLTGNLIEVGGISVKCIASNIRRSEKDWNFGLEVVQGIGKEGHQSQEEYLKRALNFVKTQ